MSDGASSLRNIIEIDDSEGAKRRIALNDRFDQLKREIQTLDLKIKEERMYLEEELAAYRNLQSSIIKSRCIPFCLEDVNRYKEKLSLLKNRSSSTISNESACCHSNHHTANNSNPENKPDMMESSSETILKKYNMFYFLKLLKPLTVKKEEPLESGDYNR